MQIYLPIAEMPVNILLLIGMGAGIGFLSGIFGVGGGFLMTPLLIFMGIPAAVAVATQANQMVIERRVDPCMSEVFSWDDIPRAHMKMQANEHKPGNMAVLVSSKLPGLRTIEDAIEAGNG